MHRVKFRRSLVNLGFFSFYFVVNTIMEGRDLNALLEESGEEKSVVVLGWCIVAAVGFSLATLAAAGGVGWSLARCLDQRSCLAVE